QWVYRPTDKEHELLMRAMERHPEYTSIAQFVHEAMMRMIHDEDLRKLYTEVGELIEELQETKEKFLSLVLKHSE
ncbi:hypothetical protein LCGC14_1896340, partial [marine sediment metagenome]